MKRVLFALLILLVSLNAEAQEETTDPLANSILKDYNGDGLVTLAAFGDSITVGKGDFTSANDEIEIADDPGREASYPLRIETFLGLPVSNWGQAGEAINTTGEDRFLSLITRNRPDIVIIAEGVNDTRIPASPNQMFRAFQKMINAASAYGTVPVLTTIMPICCGHAGLQPFIDSYNPIIRTLAAINEIALADPEHGIKNSCNVSNCNLLCRPDGLHPNGAGYDVMGEAAISVLLGINIFAPDGPTLYAQALGISPTQVRTVPDAAPPPAAAAQ